ncbi:MAG TPA: hypothetical protein PK024_12100 [Methanospirillum sp.]|uniref:hypothetical protein n=1 Tax=Methanospirillum sp. TaxID=45200 RepID=UPI002C44CA23|nr:hypothetical protein [Methanospirillum sp.]HOJ97565.1 hypothetical protein [Methanospirillum sp.]HPP77789.1 hypothetical protein [Methanospirillum sp.]
MPEETCETCKFLYYPQDNRRFGCRRYPLHIQGTRFVDGHPSQFYCGEYQSKSKVTSPRDKQ